MNKSFLYVVGTVWLVLIAGCDNGASLWETPDLNRDKSGPVENIETSERIEAASIIEATSSYRQELKLFIATVRGAFDEQDFDFLEKTASELRKSQVLFPDGSWKLTRFYEAVSQRFNSSDAGYLTDLETYKSWEQAFPESTTRRVALVEFLINYGWHARGSGYANTVTSEGWRLLRQRLGHAWEISETLRDAEDKDPYGYEMAIVAAMGLGLKSSEFDAILSDARRDFPTYYGVEVRRAYSLLPRWLGEAGDWERFAIEASNVEGGLGDEVYARILMRLKGYYADVFRDSEAVWETGKSGLNSLNEQYPQSLEIQNYSAYFAVLGRDREMGSHYFDKLGDSYLQKVWKKPERFVHFRTWAKTGRW